MVVLWLSILIPLSWGKRMWCFVDLLEPSFLAFQRWLLTFVMCQVEFITPPPTPQLSVNSFPWSYSCSQSICQTEPMGSLQNYEGTQNSSLLTSCLKTHMCLDSDLCSRGSEEGCNIWEWRLIAVTLHDSVHIIRPFVMIEGNRSALWYKSCCYSIW